jgi:hypothetical protein
MNCAVCKFIFILDPRSKFRDFISFREVITVTFKERKNCQLKTRNTSSFFMRVKIKVRHYLYVLLLYYSLDQCHTLTAADRRQIYATLTTLTGMTRNRITMK